jgi:hypothetical protein
MSEHKAHTQPLATPPQYTGETPQTQIPPEAGLTQTFVGFGSTHEANLTSTHTCIIAGFQNNARGSRAVQ